MTLEPISIFIFNSNFDKVKIIYFEWYFLEYFYLFKSIFIEYLLYGFYCYLFCQEDSKVTSRKLKCCCFATLKPAATCRCLTQSLIKPNRNRIFLFLHFCFPPLIFLHTTTKYKTFWRISGLNNTHFSWGETVKLLTGLRKISQCLESAYQCFWRLSCALPNHLREYSLNRIFISWGVLSKPLREYSPCAYNVVEGAIL